LERRFIGMKRIVMLAIIAALILGLAAFTYADVKFGASGFVRVRSAWYMNARNGIPAPDQDLLAPFTNGAWNDTQAWMDTRFRIKFTSSLDDVAKGVIYLEGDSTFWGEQAGAGAQRNQAGQWGADRAAVEVKQFYIDFKVPGLSDMVPTTVQAGIIGYYYRPHICTSTDGAGIRVDMRPGPIWVQLNWMKPWEGNTWQADDTDVYAIRVVTQGVMPVDIGVWGQYWMSNSWSAAGALAWPALGGWAVPGAGQNGGTDSARLFWLGLQANGKVGPVTLTGDFIYNGGKIEREYGFNPAAPVAFYANPIDDDTFGGWIAYLDAAFAIPNFPLEIGVTGSYSSRDHSGFYMTPGSEAAYTGHSVVFFASKANDGVGISRGDVNNSPFQLGVAGVWFAKLRATVKPLPWLAITPYAMYIGDNTDSGDLYGTAAGYTFNYPGVGLIQTLEDNSDIGIEFGLEADIQIYKNLTYSIGLGYLVAGDALDQYTGVDFQPGVGFVAGGTVVGALPINDSPDNPWAVLSQLIYKF
jgi:hypothetical protein